MVGRRGEFAVRGGILDVFAPDRRTPGARRVLGRRGHRDADVLGRRPALHPRDPGRHAGRGGLPGAAAHRRRAGAGRGSWPPTTRGRGRTSPARVGDMLAKLAEGIPVDGMEALLPVLRPDDLVAADRSAGAGHAGADVRSGEGAHPGGRPDQDRPRVPRGDVVGRRRSAVTPRSTSSNSAASGFRRPRRGPGRGARRRASLVDAEPAARRVGDGTGHPAGAVGARVSNRDIDEIFAMLRAHVRDGRVRRGGRARHRNRAPRRRTTRRIRHPGNDVGAGRDAEAPALSACSRARCTTASSCPAPTWSSSPRPTSPATGRPPPRASGWRPSGATPSTRWR